MTSAPQNGSSANPRPKRPRVRRRLILLTFSVLVFLAALKLADGVMGRVWRTEQRHWLRLTPHAKVTHKTSEFEYVYSTNSWGLRGKEIPLEKPAGTVRIAIVGDSFVAGLGVPDDCVFPAVLESLLNEASPPMRCEVINVGRAGSSTIREADLYHAVGRRFEPDVVVQAVFMGNDLVEILEEHDSEELKSWTPPGWIRASAYRAFPNLYLELAMRKAAYESQNRGREQTRQGLWQFVRNAAEERGVDISQTRARFDKMPPEIVESTRKGLFSHSSFLHACLQPQRLLRALDPDAEMIRRAWPRMTTHFERLKADAETQHARLLIILIPHAAQVDPRAWRFCEELGFEMRDDWLHKPVFLQEAIPAWCRSNAVAFLDLTAELRAAPRPVYYVQDGHWNAQGHRRVAETLAQWPELKAARLGKN